MLSFAALLRPLLVPGGRLVLVANNPALTAEDLHGLGLGAPDIVFQFNACLHAARLAGSPARQVYCFRADHRGAAFGFDAAGAPLGEVARVLRAPAGIAGLVALGRETAPVAARLDAAAPGVPRATLRRDDIRDLAARYPAALTPSSGFLVFLALQDLLAEAAMPGFLACVGFTGRRWQPGERVWHDFAFERAAISRSAAILHRCWDG